jgi:hypothetical protein
MGRSTSVREAIKYIEAPRKEWTENLTGRRFGKLVVIKYLGRSTKGNVWQAVCDCGRNTQARTFDLKTNRIRSCKCDYLNPGTTHGLNNTRANSIWCAMKSRCTNPNVDCYQDYGGRGITVCERWLNSFENFFEDMGEPPTKSLSLERKDNELGYFKENCYWASRHQQSRDKRNNRYFEYDGQRLILSDWAKVFNIRQSLLNTQLKKYSFETIRYHYTQNPKKHSRIKIKL